ncbi:maleylpyruvate isomerase family mycothiol-dependent enzyme [Brevibacterium album]|uniref:maleylpyruvate isomerase family mycothiol-dependent enzyme n=1 Tax=Brevibacterium album TaxID=417948 RepID=UPI0004049474|nr:maleylpyruvate isomerase family mycothiol-dependent enzyme [Brevibacterium album]
MPQLWDLIRAGFNANRHNDRSLAPHLGPTPAATLERFRNSVSNTIAPTKDYAAFLGEVVVHGQDIARPLGIELEPAPGAVEEVARFFTTKDFAVNSRTLVKGLSIEAEDTGFRSGTGPAVRGTLLDLVTAMAGRPGAAAALHGEGAEELRRRLA